jgi:DMSO/TMAO reductase YedYZ molybdopterin-dependent catalytic subunit
LAGFRRNRKIRYGNGFLIALLGQSGIIRQKEARMEMSSPTLNTSTQENRSTEFRLTVAGLVSRTQQFSVQGLQDYFSERTFAAPEQRTPSLTQSDSNFWTGCTLNELLDFVGVSPQAKHVEFVGLTRDRDSATLCASSVSIPIEELANTEIGLVWESGGQPVTADSGGPLVVLLPGECGFATVCGLSRINLIIVPAGRSDG